MLRIFGHGPVHRPVHVHGHLHRGVLGQRLDRAEAACYHVHHQLFGPPALRPVGHLQYLVAVSADVDRMDHLLAFSRQPVKRFGHGGGALLHRAEPLVDKGLVVLAVGQPSCPRLVHIAGGLLGREPDLRFDNGPDEGLLRAPKDLPQTVGAEPRPLVHRCDAPWELYVFEPDGLQSLEAVKVTGHHAEYLGYAADLYAEVDVRECYRH